jgi:hypothetical protein
MYNTYEKNKMIGLLYRIFQAENYRWFEKEDVGTIPTFEELEILIGRLEEDSIECKGSAESGRIRVSYDKETQTFDYYLCLGEY